MKRLIISILIGVIISGFSVSADEGKGEKVTYDLIGSREVYEDYDKEIREGTDEMAMPIDVIIEGRFLKTDTDALIIKDSAYIPLRAVADAFNMGEVMWHDDMYTAIVDGEFGRLEFPMNQSMMIKDHVIYGMPTPTLLVNDRTMVPLRFVSELLGFTVEWDPVYYTVTLSHESFEVNDEYLGGRFYNVDELKIFSRLIMKEAGSVSYETKHGVASVVMNHVRNDYFEDTIAGVIFAVHRTPHFPPAHEAGFEETVPNYECVLAAKKTLRGENSVESCIYFNTQPFKGKTVYKVVDGVYFCY